MDDAPKRSVRETITQLIVIAILLALIVGSVIYLRQYIDSRNSSDGSSNVSVSSKVTFGFNCCTGFDASAVYHPGEDVRLSWTSVPVTPGAPRKETITLSAMLSKSFPSAGAIKSGVKDGRNVNVGPFIAESSQRVSNRSGAAPLVILRIPSDARTGYYDLVTSSSQHGVSETAASIFQIRR
jgi:hypothetical protein